MPVRRSVGEARPGGGDFTVPKIRHTQRPGIKLAALLCLLALPWVALACRYNVRDLGFIDLEAQTYRFRLLVAPSTPPALVEELTASAEAAFEDSNILFDKVEVSAAASKPSGAASAAPSGLLIAPDDQTLPVSMAGSDGAPLPNLTNRLASLVSSPVRAELLKQASDCFAVILLFAGTDAGENELARQAIASAIAETTAQMKWLPKVIARPPVMVTLEVAARRAEDVLLWTFGLKTAPESSPRAAVVYGKGRWIGPMMTGFGITAASLDRILKAIGADCECGMDLSWTRGKPLPIRWEPARHSRAARELGFDPENPLVKFEAARILGKKVSATASGAGYQEISLDAAPAGSVEAQLPVEKVATPVLAAASPALSHPAAPSSGVSIPWFTLAALTAVISAGCVWIFVRAKKHEN